MLVGPREDLRDRHRRPIPPPAGGPSDRQKNNARGSLHPGPRCPVTKTFFLPRRKRPLSTKIVRLTKNVVIPAIFWHREMDVNKHV